MPGSFDGAAMSPEETNLDMPLAFRLIFATTHGVQIMTTIRHLFASILFTSISLAASAQTPPAPAAASMPMPMTGNMMSQDCAGKPAARHDHGAERNVPRAKSATAGPCGATPSASSAANKKIHDHAKFKNL